MIRRILPLALVSLVLACGPGTVPDEGPDPGRVVRELAEEAWQRQLEDRPLARLRAGLPVERLPIPSADRAREDAELARGVLERLDAVDEGRLEHDDALTAAVLRRDAETSIEAVDWYELTNLLAPYSSPLARVRQVLDALPLEDMDAAWNYLQVLRQVAELADAVREHARMQLDGGIVVPEPAVEAALGVVRAQIAPPDQGPFAVDVDRLQGLDSIQQGQFRQEHAAVVERLVNPALEELLAFLEGEYAPAAPAEVGVHQYPDGEDYYRYLTRYHTTLDVTPEQVHEIGLAMVADMEERMAAIRDEIGFAGTADEFHEMLRDDPRFFPETADEVADRLMAAADGFMERVDGYFLEIPEAPYDVRRLSADLEGSQTYGYYSPPTGTEPRGFYHYNASDLDQRTWVTLRAIALHELIPGHHFQIALQHENEALPDLRRNAMHTAYVEGWGSYASMLGLEAGIYEDDPYSRYGLYMLEIFLATRLVVDPGMNHLGWSLERAREFMREHTLESETQIATESLRYSTDMPGQALGYQMGKRTFLELRGRAEEALGEEFDLRRFHDAVLGTGSLPLSVLREHVDWYIDREREGAG